MASIDRDRRNLVVQGADKGPYSVSGTTKVEAGAVDTPVSRRVRLHDQITGRALREVWSDATTGAWTFVNIRAGEFFVLAFDHTGQYNGEVTTGIKLPTPP
jgi:hypothetical protein